MSQRWRIVCLAAGCSIVPAASVLGAKLPDWAQAIADTAPVLDAVPGRHSVRILLGETRITVGRDGAARTRRRLASQALSAKAQDVHLGYFSFRDDARILKAHAWHVPPGEKVEKNRGPTWDMTLDDSFLSDRKTRLVHIPEVRRGSLVFFEFEALDLPDALSWSTLFLEDAPTDVARFELELPEGWTFRHAWLRAAGPEPVTAGALTRWEIRDLATPEEEALGPSVVEQAPLLIVSALPPPGTKTTPAVLDDWLAVAAWFERVAAGRDAPGPEVAAAVRQAMPEASQDLYQTVRTTGAWVRDRVRYLAREIGIGHYQPRPAAQVLKELYGDCKDKGTLFRALLAAEGIRSYPILINATSADTVDDRVPSPSAFNHFVVGVSLPDPGPVPPSMASATVEAGDLGRLLIVDVTDENSTIGSMPAGLAGKKGLVVAGESSRVLTLPANDPSVHVIERRLEARLEDGGGLALRMRTRLLGDPAAVARAAYRRSSRDRRRDSEKALFEEWVNPTEIGYAVEPESADGSFIETVEWRAQARSSGSSRLFLYFPGALDDLPRVSTVKRKAPVRYGHAMTLKFETVLEGVPAEATLPTGEQVREPGWSVTSGFERRGEAIHATWEATLSRTAFEPAAFEDLRRFWAAAGRATSPALVLQP